MQQEAEAKYHSMGLTTRLVTDKLGEVYVTSAQSYDFVTTDILSKYI